MRNVERRRRWIVPALAIMTLLIVMCWLYVHPGARGPERTVGVIDRGNTTEVASHSRVGPRVGAQPVEPGVKAPGRSAIALPAAMQKALDEHPQLAQYYRLQQKVLPTAEERKTLRGMLADSNLIEMVKEELLVPESTYTKEAEAKRMVAVEFLTDAVAWADNPATGAVMEAIEAVVFADNISADASEDLARSLAGDKMELYTQMLHRSPDRAAMLADNARGKAVEPFLTYSKNWYDQQMRAMKADEIR
jgi:hypothetical protein